MMKPCVRKGGRLPEADWDGREEREGHEENEGTKVAKGSGGSTLQLCLSCSLPLPPEPSLPCLLGAAKEGGARAP